MPEQSFELWIEAEEWPEGEWEPGDSVTDVVVSLGDGSRWIATFCAFSHVDSLRRTCAASGENLHGRYLWASDLVLVEDTSRATIADVVADIVAAGDLPSAFSELAEGDDAPHAP
jgi:hypothetical protein